MKKIFYTMFFILILLLSYHISLGQTFKLDSVKIEFEGFYTETIADVTCDNFNYTFLKTKKTKVIHNQQDLIKLELLRKDFKIKKNRALDVRGKVTYHYGNKNAKYCFDIFGNFYKDGTLFYNKKLLIALSDNIYPNHPGYLDTLRQHE